MQSYTPGPWTHEEELVRAARGFDTPLIGYSIRAKAEDYEVVIAEIHPKPYPVAVTPENACLIAAAPDLYEAAKEALAWVDAGGEEDVESGQAHVAQTLRVAIAKAEGRE